jgi:hypothetical protein
MPRWDKCLNVNDDYVKSDVYRLITMRHVHQSQNKVLRIRVFVVLFFRSFLYYSGISLYRLSNNTEILSYNSRSLDRDRNNRVSDRMP